MQNNFEAEPMIFCDSHVHLSQCSALDDGNSDYWCCSSCLSKEDFIFSTRIKDSAAFGKVLISYGIHPQSVSDPETDDYEENLAFLSGLISDKKIGAVGEFGFDFYSEGDKSLADRQSRQSVQDRQKKIFELQLELAKKANLPVVLHVRKAMDRIFAYSKELSCLPSVVFHSFPGTYSDAVSLLNKKINAFFSFGTPVLKGKKANISCIKNLPAERILFETDAPYQSLKMGYETKISDIRKVYARSCEIREESPDEKSLEELCLSCHENFRKAFCIDS